MGQSKGEGRAKSEKSQRVFEPASVRRERLAKAKAEEAAWAARSGPVVVRRAD